MRGKMKGYIHSIETFGTVDGPGVRFVVFFQGCPMRCAYCHNPDSWILTDGEKMSAKELLDQMERNRSFYRTGGLTASGGEPMMQTRFLTELFSQAKERGFHTCLDTSGIMFPDRRSGEKEKNFKERGRWEDERSGIGMEELEVLMRATDLVLLDIKHIREDEHWKLTGHSNGKILDFAKYLDDIGKPVWIRHVVVPGITSDEKELRELGRFLKTLHNIEKLEVLPYHSLGEVKYAHMGIDYPLKGTPQLSKEEARAAKELIEKA